MTTHNVGGCITEEASLVSTTAAQAAAQLGSLGVAGRLVLFSLFGMLPNYSLFLVTDVCIIAGGGLHGRGLAGQYYSCPGSCPAGLAGRGGAPGPLQLIRHAAQLLAVSGD